MLLQQPGLNGLLFVFCFFFLFFLLGYSPLAELRVKHKYSNVRATLLSHKCEYPVGAALCLMLL